MMRMTIGKETKCKQHAALAEVLVRLTVFISCKHDPEPSVLPSGGK